MRYTDLYDWVQTHSGRVSTNEIRRKLVSEGVVSSIQEFWYGFNPGIVRAAFLRGPLNIGPFQLTDSSDCLFAVAREIGVDRRERRVTICKELMHVFDAEGERVRSADDLDVLLSYLAQVSSEAGRIAATEPRALARALASIVPDSLRQEAALRASTTTLYELSADLGVPERHVEFMLRSDFKRFLDLT